MNIQGNQVATDFYIKSWESSIAGETLTNDVGKFKGEKVTFYSEEAERAYTVYVHESKDKGRFVNVNVTAETGRKNIFSRMVGAVADAFKRLVTPGMKFNETRAHQMKSKIENDILKQAINAATKPYYDKKTIEDGFRAATQLNNKLGIDDLEDRTRLHLAKTFYQNHYDASLLLQLQDELVIRMNKLEREAASFSASASFCQGRMVLNSVDGALNMTHLALTGDNSARQRVDDARGRIQSDLWMQNHYNRKLVKTHDTIRSVSARLLEVQNAFSDKIF
ncbi:hypothetical protein [Endozoicomonas sp. 8E]|uniref:hypothetical protein n=1 Tax=Endozoicomonas sp. 8E TaxID=3035692 RepID=UPI0029393B57|nr:hypothetical protein [Endozoicomonas sp. 8E]WOG27187.1 hypothetical protein P6910_21965 [Endozoicomonas sp. 8E]